jgi:glycosyltransferase involved in cell wall biosynthesis
MTFLLPMWFRRPVGGVRIVYGYANELSRRGHSVTLVHGAFMEPWQYRHPLRLRRDLRIAARSLVDVAPGAPDGPSWEPIEPEVSVRYVRTLSAPNVPDGEVVVATSWRTAESAARLPARCGQGAYLLQHLEDWDGPADRVAATWRLPLERIVLARWLEQLGEQLGGPAHRIPGWGADLAAFQLRTPIAERLPRVAMLHSTAPVKGAAVGLRALQLAHEVRPQLQAVLFGTRPRPADLPAWIDYHQDPPRQVLVEDIYNGSSTYLCPSWSEGWHLPPVEALGCGCALVSTAIDGVADYAHDGRTALLAPAGDAGALAGHLVRLVDDEALRRSLAQAGHDEVQQFTLERSTDALERVLAARVG